MSRVSMEDLIASLKESRENSSKKKKLMISLDETRYKELITAIVLENNGKEELYKSFQETINKIVDLYLSTIDFYDLTENDMNRIVDIFEEIV
jgi:hypothetical protein